MSGQTNDETAAKNDPPGHDLVALLIGGAALVLLVLAPWLVDRSGSDPFYKGPLIFPMMVLALTAAAAMPALFRLGRSLALSPYRFDGGGFPVRGAALFALMCFYPAAISAAGLEIATFLAAFAGLVVVGRPLLQSALIAAALSATLFTAFKAVLDLWFPQPWLLEPWVV
jgi:hypothetical protein